MRCVSTCFQLLTVILCVLGCDNVKSNQSSDAYLDMEQLEDLTATDATTAVQENAIVGTWVPAAIGWNDAVEFKSDGSGLTIPVGAEDEAMTFDWQLAGNVLSVAFFGTELYDGETCRWTEQAIITISLVNGTMYLGVLIRTDGDADGYDGTWKITEGEIGEYRCGNEFDEGSEIDTITLNITGNTFTGTRYSKWEESWSYAEESEGDSGIENTSFSGAVSQEGDYLVLRADDGETVYTLNPISNNVMLFSEDEPEYAEESWNTSVYVRQ